MGISKLLHGDISGPGHLCVADGAAGGSPLDKNDQLSDQRRHRQVQHLRQDHIPDRLYNAHAHGVGGLDLSGAQPDNTAVDDLAYIGGIVNGQRHKTRPVFILDRGAEKDQQEQQKEGNTPDNGQPRVQDHPNHRDFIAADHP